MRTMLWDLETDGLLDTVSKIHCCSAIDVDTKEVFNFRPGEDAKLMKLLDTVDVHIGHNLWGYDLKVMKKLHNWEPKAGAKVIDTLVAAELLWPDIGKRDMGRAKKGFPANLIGRHNLESYGHRLGLEKGTFGKTADWRYFSEEMMEYCELDVKVNLLLYNRIIKKGYSEDALMLEYMVRDILDEQQRLGWRFDEKAAIRLYGDLCETRDNISVSLREMFDGWWAPAGVTTPKRSVKYKSKPHTVEGAPYTKIKWVEFNPGSRDHLAKVLLERGWKPKAFTPGGKPQVDESSLAGLKFEGAWDMYLYLSYQKILGMLSEGKQGWMTQVKDGRIHHRCRSIGTVTSRGAHSGPNLGQVPSAKKKIDGRAIGLECRELFTADEGWVMVGADQDGLELRMLGHYLARWDGGAYAKAVHSGDKANGTDIHSENMRAAGLDDRDKAKTFIYCWLYGGGAGAVAAALGCNQRKAKATAAKFLAGIPGLAQFIKAVKGAVKKRGCVKTLDGRQVPVSSDHAALNYLLQSAGAIVCKRWMVITHELMAKKGYVHGVDWKQHGWVHDELQCSCPKEVVKDLVECLEEAGRLSGEYYDLRCPTVVTADVGENWKDTH